LTISTFGGNPVTCATARAVIDVIEEDDLRTNAANVGSYFRQKLEALREKYPLIGDVRGMGLMQAMELVEDRETKQPRPKLQIPLWKKHANADCWSAKAGFTAT